MPFVVEQDVTLDPRDVGFLGANRIVLALDGLTDTSTSLVEELFLGSSTHLHTLHG